MSVSEDRFRPAVIYSTVSTDAIRDLIVQHYSPGNTPECTLHLRNFSDTYKVSMAGSTYALRLYRARQRSREAILGELEALRYVAQQGVAVALPIARDDGEWITELHAPEGLRSAVMFDWLPGRATEYTRPSDAKLCGQLLGALHAATDDLMLDAVRPALDMDALFFRPLESVRRRALALPRVRTALDDFVERLGPRVERAPAQLRDWGFCHGDLYAGNAVVDRNQVGLIDFDFCGPGWRIADVGSYRWHARYLGSEETAWPAFIDGYCERRPGIAASMPFIGLFMILKHFWVLHQWLARSRESGALTVPDELFEKLIPFCEKIEAEGL